MRMRWMLLVGLLSVLLLALFLCPADARVTTLLPPVARFYTTTISIPTYPYTPYLTLGYDAVYSMTYPVLDWDAYEAANPSPAPHDYELLVMDNPYLTVTLLPELGGRVYQIIDKSTGHNHLYQNPVVKPTHWGPPQQGWWMAVGGIEWCLPVDEHGYQWGVPWAWSAVTSTAGVTVTVRDAAAPDRLRAAVDLFLPATRAYLAVTPRLENPTAAPIDYKFWLNAALAPGPANRPSAGLRFHFNATEMSVHSTGDARLPGAAPIFPTGPDYRFAWPVYQGVDFSRLGNWHQWLGFFEYPQAPAGFVGVYDEDAGAGVVRTFPYTVARGTKGFGYGWSDPLDWHIWTDEASGGVELHGGVAPTFWDTATLTAGATLAWTEVWYPVGGVGGITHATREALLYVRATSDALDVGVHATRERAADEHHLYVWERATCELVAYRRLPGLTPATPYRALLPRDGHVPDALAVVYTDDADRVLAASAPVDCAPQPRLALRPARRVLFAELANPRLITTSVAVTNTGLGTLRWTAALSPTGQLTPLLPITQGEQGAVLPIVVDARGWTTGTYRGGVQVTAHPTDTLDSPQRVEVVLYVVPSVTRLYLPCVLRH